MIKGFERLGFFFIQLKENKLTFNECIIRYFFENRLFSICKVHAIVRKI